MMQYHADIRILFGAQSDCLHFPFLSVVREDKVEKGEVEVEEENEAEFSFPALTEDAYSLLYTGANE